MEWIEVVARSVDEAKELALDRLGVIEDELEFEVVQEPRSGVLGIGRLDARIRARVRPVSREKPSDRRRRSRPGRGRDSTRRRSGERRSADDAAPRDDGGDRASRSAGSGGARTGGPGRGGRRRGRGGRGDRDGTTTAAVARPEQEDSTVDDQDDLSIDEQADAAKEFAAGLVVAFGLAADVEASVGDDAVDVTIEGTELGILVGPKGATLTAIEELTRAVVQHATNGQSARIHVDVSGYRQRRREALAEFTRGLAAEVQETGEERALEPMAAPDRKVVHDTVAELEGVTTVSEGEDPRRRVVIRPE